MNMIVTLAFAATLCCCLAFTAADEVASDVSDDQLSLVAVRFGLQAMKSLGLKRQGECVPLGPGCDLGGCQTYCTGPGGPAGCGVCA